MIPVLFITAFSSAAAWAHPVSYKDAVGLMSYNTPQMNEVLLTYSLTPSFAVAGTYLRDSKSEFAIPRANFLLKRWNNEDSQANVYFSGGVGVEKFADTTYGARLAELVADWESRKYYLYFDHLYLNRDNPDNSSLTEKDYNHSKLRAGLAPFLADYNELNVWLILQGERHLDESKTELTQFLRVYMKNVLWEIGARFDGGWAFNYMVHF
jgi:hypothetical protein